MKILAIVQFFSLCFLYSGPMGVVFILHGYGSELLGHAKLGLDVDLPHEQTILLTILVIPTLLVILTSVNMKIRKSIQFNTLLDKFFIVFAEILPLMLILCVNFSAEKVIISVLFVTALRFYGVTIQSIFKRREYLPLFNGASVFALYGQIIYLEGSAGVSTLSLLVSQFISYRIYANSLPTIRKLRDVLSNKPIRKSYSIPRK